MYVCAQFKNKWDQLKKDWKLWKELKHGATGLGWDSTRRTVDASDDWWKERLEVVPAAKKFRYAGIPPELEEKFKNLVANAREIQRLDRRIVATNNLKSTRRNPTAVEAEADEEEGTVSPLPSPNDMEEYLDVDSSGRTRQKRITEVLTKIVWMHQANSLALMRLERSVERRMAVIERDYTYLLGKQERQVECEEASPGRYIAYVRDQLLLAN
ncbi:hypothetical protein KSP39_PZI013768 [Platanthera zijinensis]|uniref:Myb/SANT-like domain-containing protein n=1 Tax=Platanthera zijinensis TaxID=2320716 RepID=A0AAP0BDI4_9ASPA